MAELRDFDPESMKDALDTLIRYVEETAIEALTSERIQSDFEGREIALALSGIRPAVNALIRLKCPETENDFGRVLLGTLIADLMTIGFASNYTEDARKHLLEIRASIMRMKSTRNSQAREKVIKCAILEVCGRTSLKGSLKFAKSIQSDVREKLGVEKCEYGYSASTFQKIIGSILKERKKS